MAYKLYLLPKAENDYNEAVNWYKGQSAEAALLLLNEMSDALEALENHPLYYSYFNQPYRRILLKSFPYKIVYEIDGDKVMVYAISHTSRNDDELRKRLL